MGQTIEINQTTVIGDVLLVDTDRTLAGQDGEAYSSREDAQEVVERSRRAEGFPARLAVQLFDADPAVDHVFVMSNQVTIRRQEGWDDETVDRTARLIAELFRFYPD